MYRILFIFIEISFQILEQMLKTSMFFKKHVGKFAVTRNNHKNNKQKASPLKQFLKNYLKMREFRPLYFW